MWGGASAVLTRVVSSQRRGLDSLLTTSRKWGRENARQLIGKDEASWLWSWLRRVPTYVCKDTMVVVNNELSENQQVDVGVT